MHAFLSHKSGLSAEDPALVDQNALWLCRKLWYTLLQGGPPPVISRCINPMNYTLTGHLSYLGGPHPPKIATWGKKGTNHDTALNFQTNPNAILSNMVLSV